MRKPLIRQTISPLYWINSEGAQISGPCPGLRGECSNLRGDCSNLRGDCSRIWGDCSNLRGDLDQIPNDARPCDIANWVAGEEVQP